MTKLLDISFVVVRSAWPRAGFLPERAGASAAPTDRPSV